MYRLRELERDDIPTINSWRSDKDLIDKLGAPFRYINEEIDFKWYDNYISNRLITIRCSILNDKDQIIGLVSLTNIDQFNQSAIFHIMIGDSSNRAKGAGYFATNEILKHAFLDMNLNRVELSILESNQRALALYDKVGFRIEGVKRKSVYKNGTFVDLVIMSVLREDFLERWSNE